MVASYGGHSLSQFSSVAGVWSAWGEVNASVGNRWCEVEALEKSACAAWPCASHPFLQGCKHGQAWEWGCKVRHVREYCWAARWQAVAAYAELIAAPPLEHRVRGAKQKTYRHL